ncbi:histidine kinase [Dactylosporangium sp. AC04546]|uniref:sensor histidine kinase n=1 Tax=Dactylosporangium sp. AC04546 TaxID=2862460 RepID=UPI001EDF4865|nr:ATP-binding protein [Dactylosporangium sp. AC04546]WVK81722.1 histidine kinase [Dactylosporangium sp. AC04546]
MYWQAFRAAPEALIVLDAAGVVRLASKAAETLFRRSTADLVGRRVDELFLADPRPDAGPDRPTTAAALLPDGHQLPVDVRARTLEGDPSGLVVLAVDDQCGPGPSRATLEQRVARLLRLGQEQGELLGDLILNQERERARIAAGVHDDSLQVITAAMLRVQQLRRRLRDPEELEILGRLEESLVNAAERLRRLIFDFRPPKLEDDGLAAATRDLLDGLADDHDLAVQLQNRLTEEPALPTRLLLYRMLQEAVANVGKHADADRCTVVLGEQDGGYLVRVVDDGVGSSAFGEPEPGHLGIVLMRERAALAGGWFRIGSEPGSGTTVTFWVPRGADLQSKGGSP